MESNATPHERLRLFRLALDMSQSALATTLGCSKSYIGKLETSEPVKGRPLRFPGRRLARRIEWLTAASGMRISASDWDRFEDERTG